VLHGYADYGERYAHVADAWAARGISTLALDMRGHGHAEGRRGYCERFDEYLDDVAELVRLLQERSPAVPAFLFGHSFGGLVAVESVRATPSPWRGLLLSNPFLGIALDVPRAKVLAGKVASRVVPGLSLPAGLRGAQMTHDPQRARAYDEDPLIFKNARARWFTETAAAQDRAVAGARGIALPLYIAVGGADPVAKRARARAFFDDARSTDKTWVERPGLLHEILNEPEWPAIAGAMADWIIAHAA
jgi:alpha-beta hydrolase superfamily lysophospholipase